MPFSLLDEAWLPVRRRSGRRDLVRPADIVSDIDGDSVVDFAWGRPDFDAASREFTIGLLATGFAPEDDESFEEFWRRPPGAAQLDDAFAPFAEAFVLDGQGPRFGQDLDDLKEDKRAPDPLDWLIMGGSSENAEENNTDLFYKRGAIPFLSRAAAAIALFTLQTYAPSGGQGHRTSLRGGGPMTTLVRPGDDKSLWRFLWLNAPPPAPNASPPRDSKDSIFPWLKPTVTSEGSRKVTPASSHPLQVFWGMPRRIRLTFTPNSAGAACPITGLGDETVVTGFCTLAYGVSYEAFEHPLSPYYREKPTTLQWRPIHPQPGGIPYRDWPSLVVEPSPENDVRRPAAVVPEAMNRLRDVYSLADRRSRLIASGFDTKQNLTRGFVEAEMPLFALAPAARPVFDSIARALAATADLTANVVARAVRDALAGDKADVKATPFSVVRESFFERTERAFFEALNKTEEALRADEDPNESAVTLRLAAGDAWLRVLRREGLSLFEDHVQPEDRPEHEMERAMQARKNLFWFFSGRGKDGYDLYSRLSLPPPEKDAKKKARAAA